MTPFHARLAASPTAKRLAHGSLWSLVGSASARILVLLAMILTTRILGQVSFGEFGLIQATVGVFGIMAGLGLGSAATRFVAQYSKVDPARAGRVIALVNASSVATVVMSSLFLVTLSGVLAKYVFETAHLQSAIILGALLLAANTFRGVQNGIFAGLESFDAIAKLNILDGVLSLPAIVVFASLFGLKGALLGFATSTAFVWIVGRFMQAEYLRIRGIEVDYRSAWTERRILLDYSVPTFLANSVATPVLWIAMTILVRSAEDGFAHLGTYSAAYQWQGPLVFLPMILMSVSIPVLVQEWESGQIHRFRKIFFGVAGIALATTFAGALLISLVSPYLMSLYGPGFSEGWMLLVVLAMAAPFHAVAKISSAALLGMNKAWWQLFANLVWGIILISCTILMKESLGILGLAIAFFIAYLILASLTFVLVLVRSRTPGTVRTGTLLQGAANTH